MLRHSRERLFTADGVHHAVRQAVRLQQWGYFAATIVSSTIAEPNPTSLLDEFLERNDTRRRDQRNSELVDPNKVDQRFTLDIQCELAGQMVLSDDLDLTGEAVAVAICFE